MEQISLRILSFYMKSSAVNLYIDLPLSFHLCKQYKGTIYNKNILNIIQCIGEVFKQLCLLQVYTVNMLQNRK